MKSLKITAIFLGLASSFFFAITFLLNRSLALAGNSWMWSASLRFFFMLPILLILVGAQGKMNPVIEEIKRAPGTWLVWSTIGFGIFYALVTFSSNYAPAWLIAGTWQIAIIAGMLVDPLIRRGTPTRQRKFPVNQLFFSLIILSGVILIQVNQARTLPLRSVFLGTLPVVAGAFAYPAGNRKMMHVTEGRLSAYQRMLGMTVCSMPFWILFSMLAICRHQLPNKDQLLETFLVALSSGIIATTLYFKATDKAVHNHRLLASVEATLSGAVLFSLLGEVFVLHGHMPDAYGWTGIVLLCSGMVLHSLI